MASAELVGSEIFVQTTYAEKTLIQPLPGARWAPAAKLWRLPATWAACLQLRAEFGAELEVGPALRTWSWAEFQRRVQPSLARREMLDAPALAGLDPRLFPFQRAGVDWMLTAGSGLLADDMGSGKTVQFLQFLRAAEALPALVACPNGVVFQWAAEAADWLPEATPYPIVGSAADRRRTLEAAATDPTALVLVNIEALRLLSRLVGYGSLRLARCRECDPKHGEETLPAHRCEVHEKPLNQIPFAAVAVDEAHRIKDARSKQTRAAQALGRGVTVRHRWGLTGTPVANHPGDLWSILNFVDPDEHPVKGKYVDRYTETAWNRFGGLDIVGLKPSRRAEFFQVLDPRMRRVPKALVLPQLPPRVRVTRYVDMTPKQTRAYREVEAALTTVLEDGTTLIAPSNAVGQIRLLQFAATYCDAYWEPAPTEDDPDHMRCVVTMREPSPKLDELLIVLEEMGDRPCAITAQSRQLIDLAAARLARHGLPNVVLTGAQAQWEQEHARQRFQRGEVPYLLFTMAAGGTGLNLTVTDTCVYLQRDWSMLLNEQTDGRFHRPGAEKHSSITYIDIVARDTIEGSLLFPRLREKQARLEEITRDRAHLARLGRSTADLDSEEFAILHTNLGW